MNQLIRPFAVVGLLIGGYQMLKSPDVPQDAPHWQTLELGQQDMVRQLVDARWLPRTASAVVARLGVDGVAAVQGKETQKTLSALWEKDALKTTVQDHPEVAALLAASQRPEAMAALFNQSLPTEDRNLIYSSFFALPRNELLDDWADALSVHQKDILRLLRRTSMALVMTAYTFDRRTSPTEAKMVDDWLDEFLGENLPDHELASRLYFAADTSAELLRHLSKNPALVTAFPKIWPQFRNEIQQQSDQPAIAQPVWHWLSRNGFDWRSFTVDRCIEMVRRHSIGFMPHFFGQNAVPKALWPVLADAFVDYDPVLTWQVVKFKDEQSYPKFANLVTRIELIQAGIFLQAKPSSDHARILEKWTKNPSTFEEDVKPDPNYKVIPGLTLIDFFYGVFVKDKEWTGWGLGFAILDGVGVGKIAQNVGKFGVAGLVKHLKPVEYAKDKIINETIKSVEGFSEQNIRRSNELGTKAETKDAKQEVRRLALPPAGIIDRGSDAPLIHLAQGRFFPADSATDTQEHFEHLLALHGAKFINH